MATRNRRLRRANEKGRGVVEKSAEASHLWQYVAREHIYKAWRGFSGGKSRNGVFSVIGRITYYAVVVVFFIVVVSVVFVVPA